MAARTRYVGRSSTTTAASGSKPAIGTGASSSGTKAAWDAAKKAELVAYAAGKTQTQVIAVGAQAAMSAQPNLSRVAAYALATQVYPLVIAAIQRSLGAGVKSLGTGFGWLDAILPYVKVAAGGLGLLVSGMALVYVAGRNTKAGQAVVGGSGVLATQARTVGRVATAPRRRAAAQRAAPAPKPRAPRPTPRTAHQPSRAEVSRMLRSGEARAVRRGGE